MEKSFWVTWSDLISHRHCTFHSAKNWASSQAKWNSQNISRADYHTSPADAFHGSAQNKNESWNYKCVFQRFSQAI